MSHVVDSANKAIKSEEYTYDTKSRKDICVESATMFDVNKTIMQCNVKIFKELAVKQRVEILEGLNQMARTLEVQNGNKVYGSGKSEG